MLGKKYSLAELKTLPTLQESHTDNLGGFEYTSSVTDGIGSWAADMGVELYNNLGPNSISYGWKPVIILKKKIVHM